ncbi:MAG: hypothetical protein AB7W59_21880 [Acidimicrobiia bacterium]
MAKSLDDARQELDKEYRQFREQWGRVHVAMSDVDRAGPTDDIHALLEKLEDVVKDVRTGGVWGSGAKGHRAARQDWLDAGGG